MRAAWAVLAALLVLTPVWAAAAPDGSPSSSFLVDEARRTSGAWNVTHNASRYGLPDGLDGSGIGIALVDTGVDVRHPDLPMPHPIQGRYEVTADGVVPFNGSAPASGHGTHMAGILAGTGNASNGTHQGVAPGATLYSFRSFSHGRVLRPAETFRWILEHGDELDPPIRIVVNAWGCRPEGCAEQGPDQPHLRMASKLVEAGYVVVFAAGNDGGDGSQAMTDAEAVVPTPGVVGVADLGIPGTTSGGGCVVSLSSRGHALDPATWPDVAAPGDKHTTTRMRGTGEEDVDPYTPFGGTSAAAGHLGGVVALMLQANPDLDPATVERILESTARKPDCGIPYVRADPAHPGDPANYAAGHGHLNATAAVQAALDPPGEPDPVPLEALPPSFHAVASPRDRPLRTFGIDHPWQRSPGVTAIERGNFTFGIAGHPVVRTSGPFQSTLTVQSIAATIGVRGDLGRPSWLAGPARLTLHVEEIGATGPVTDVGTVQVPIETPDDDRTVWRSFGRESDNVVTLMPGDRLRVTVDLEHPVVPLSDDEIWFLAARTGGRRASLSLG